MQPVISAEQATEIDRLTSKVYQIPSLLLMQAAAEACFNTIADHFSGRLANKKAQILCGQGNNGGDGAALALALCRGGVQTDVLLIGTLEASKGDARTNLEIIAQLASFSGGSTDRPSVLSFVECNSSAAWENLAKPRRTYDLIVDALFGTGLSRPLEGMFIQVVQHLAMLRRARERSATRRPLIISVDLPSGLNADLAKPIGQAIQADLTVTFTAPKHANVLPPASHLNGKLVIANIGSPVALIDGVNPQLFVTEETDVRQWLISTRYARDSFKNTHGHVLVIAGSPGYTGAAVLCGNAAIRAGAGLVTIASAQSDIAVSVMPEVITTALAETDRGAVSDAAIAHLTQLTAKATVIAIGPGLTAEDERTRRFVFSVVKQRQTPLVIDADALNCLANYSSKGWPAELHGSDDLNESPLILTPHPGEMLRLLGTTDKAALDDRVAVARAFATRHKLILVLKGTRSLVAAPDGRVFINPTGNAGLGTAGAGDTLTGIIAGFTAQTAATLKKSSSALSATIAALYLGGLAGDLAARDLGMRTMVASDIREHLSEAIRSLDPKGEQP